jgi:hypothetical protein
MLETAVRTFESEKSPLMGKLWGLHLRSTLPVAIALSSLGGISMIFAYFESSLILTFIGLGSLFWGAMMFYISPSRLVRADVVDALIPAMQNSFNAIINLMGYTGEVVFFHPRTLKGLTQGYVFISHNTVPKPKIDVLNLLPNSSADGTPSIHMDPKGTFLIAPSQRLVDLFEKEMRINFAAVNFGYLQETLPKLLIEDLELIDNISLIETDDAFTVTMSGGPFVKMCRQTSENKSNSNHIWCPICSTLALVFSKLKGMPISIEETLVNDSDTISIKFAVRS